MAIDGMCYSPKEIKLMVSEETTFGTADTSGTGLVEFESVNVDYGITQDISRKNRGALPLAYDSDVYVTGTGGIRTITINNLVHRKEDIADFLYGVFQTVVEGAAGDYQKQFVANSSGQPDFSSNEGYFATIAIDKHLANYHELYKSCICTDLTLSFDMVGGDGRLRSTSTWISGFNWSITEASGVVDAPKSQVYFDMNGMDTAQYNSNDIVIYSGEIHIQNFGKRVGNDSSGQAQSYCVWKPEFLMEGTLTVKYDSNTAGIKGDYLAGTQRVLQFGWTDGTADGEIFFDMDEIVVTSYEDVEQDDGAAITFGFKGVYDSDTPTAPEIMMADAVDRSF